MSPVGVHPSVPNIVIQGADGLPEVDKRRIGVLAVEHRQRRPGQDGENGQAIPTTFMVLSYP
jgi:hypothetical protein